MLVLLVGGVLLPLLRRAEVFCMTTGWGRQGFTLMGRGIQLLQEETIITWLRLRLLKGRKVLKFDPTSQ